MTELSKSEEIFMFLGFHTAYWNKAEEALDKLLVNAIGDTAKAHILTSGANAKKRVQFLKLIFEECCPEEPWIDVALAALTAFDALRKNRNVLAHGVALGLRDEEGELNLKVKTLHASRRAHKQVSIDGDKLVDEVNQVRALTAHLNTLRAHIYHRDGAHIEIIDVLRRERPALPDKFPLPALLQTPESQNYSEPLIRRSRPPEE